MRVIDFFINEEHEGDTVLQYLKRSGFSAREIRRVKFRGDGICVNQEKTNVRAVLHSGDVLAVCLDETEEQPEKIFPWPGPLEVLYLDEDLIAVNKPSGMAIHPSHGHYADTLLNRVTAYLMDCGESTGLHVIGRLDKETSGVVVFARNQLAAAGIGRQKQQKAAGFASGTEKEYLAWVCGSPEDSEGTVNAPIGSDPDTLQWMHVCPEGKPAVTHYEVLQCRGGFSLLHLRLETGRTHQIRVHMAYIGHPLAGDRHYGGASDSDGSGFTHAALHAERISLTHPITGVPLDIHAPLPEEWSYLPLS